MLNGWDLNKHDGCIAEELRKRSVDCEVFLEECLLRKRNIHDLSTGHLTWRKRWNYEGSAVQRAHGRIFLLHSLCNDVFTVLSTPNPSDSSARIRRHILRIWGHSLYDRELGSASWIFFSTRPPQGSPVPLCILVYSCNWYFCMHLTNTGHADFELLRILPHCIINSNRPSWIGGNLSSRCITNVFF